MGPGSVGFEEEEAKVDRRHGLPVGVCQFHRLDRAGYHADRQFPITLVYDRFLRLIRRSFGFGTGVLILRATAKEFDRLVGLLAADAATYGTQAAEAEVAGRPVAAEKYKVARAKAAAHAMAFRRAGWTEFRRPLAPRADGTRKGRVAFGGSAAVVRHFCFDLLGVEDPHLRNQGIRTNCSTTERPSAGLWRP